MYNFVQKFNGFSEELMDFITFEKSKVMF